MNQVNSELLKYENDLLRYMIQNPKDILRISGLMNQYYIQQNNKVGRIVFQSLVALAREGRSINRITLESKASIGVRDFDTLNAFIDYISEGEPQNLIEENIAFVEYHYKQRKIAHLSAKINEIATRKVTQFEDINELAFQIIETAGEKGEEDSAADLLQTENTIPFKHPTLAQYLKNLPRKNIIVIGAEVGHGKSMITIPIARDALEQGYKVLVFSIEMSFIEFAQRLASNLVRVNSNLIVEPEITEAKPKGRLTDEEHEKVQKAGKYIQEQWIKTKRLVIRDKTTTLGQMKFEIRTEKPDIVIIDPIQAMETNEKAETTAAGITANVAALKTISKEVNCAMLFCAWTNSGARKPKAWDMFQSKSMDKWASRIWLLYYYFKVNPNARQFKNILEIIDGKQRFGELASRIVDYRPEYAELGTLDKSIENQNLLSIYKKMTANLAKDQ